MELSSLHIKFFILLSLILHSGLFAAFASVDHKAEPSLKKSLVINITKISKKSAAPIITKTLPSLPALPIKKKLPAKKKLFKKTLAKTKTVKKPLPIKDLVSPSPKKEVTISEVSPESITNYENLILSKLENNKYYPRYARRRKLEGEGVIRLKLARDGHLISYKLEKSFGFSSLNKAITQMVERSAPFPDFPESIDRDSFDFIVPIKFSLRTRNKQR